MRGGAGIEEPRLPDSGQDGLFTAATGQAPFPFFALSPSPSHTHHHSQANTTTISPSPQKDPERLRTSVFNVRGLELFVLPEGQTSLFHDW